MNTKLRTKTSSLWRNSKHLLLFLVIATFQQLSAQSVSKLYARFVGCEAVVNFSLSSGSPVDVTLMYSGDGGITWLPCTSVSGNIKAQTTGNKTITWDCHADGIRWGQVKFRVDVPRVQAACVTINGVCWATRNLDVGGRFVSNPEDYGALYQWGRPADGHESRTSATTTALVSTNTPGHNKFIISASSPYDWRSPRNDSLWNAGTEAAPVKAANDPSPAGYRVPTAAEIDKLLDATKVTRTWTTLNGVNGYRFTDIASSNWLFFPAAGYRLDGNGTVHNVGTGGDYWGSMVVGADAYSLDFRSGGANGDGFSRAFGFSVRPVAE